MKIVYDIGMYDASDTEYFLECGYDVLAVEANPVLAKQALERLDSHVQTGRLRVINAAVADSEGHVDLNVCGDDLGSSSIVPGKISGRPSAGKYVVPTISVQSLFQAYGVPFYLKIDIEGADALFVRSLTRSTRPELLSFETDDNLEEVLAHVASIGFTKFKLINQLNFLELSNQSCLRERLARKLIRMLGYSEPQYVKRAGRWFKCYHSSGPGPWCSDGKWDTLQKTLDAWRRAKSNNQLRGWYDVHAA